MEPKLNKFDGQELRDVRKLSGLSQEKLGEKIDKSRETISAIENNHPKAIEALTIDVIERWTRECYQEAKRVGERHAAESKKRSIVGKLAALFEW